MSFMQLVSYHKNTPWQDFRNQPFFGYIQFGYLCPRSIAEKVVGMEGQKLDDPFGVLFEANPLPMWIFDVQSLAFLAVNDAVVQHYGYPRDKFLKMTLRDIRPPEDIPSLQQAVAKNSRQNGLVDAGEWRHIRQDGSMIYVEICSQGVLYGGHEARLAMLNDITERKITEGALRRSEKRLNEAQRVAGLGSWEWNIEYTSNSYSDELFRIFGFPPQGVHIDIDTLVGAIHPDDRERMRRLFEEVGREPRNFAATFRVLLPDGTVRHVHGQGDVTYDRAGKPLKMTGTALDVTERMAMEEERLRNARLQAANKELEAFSYTVSHDLRTPLRSIDAFGKLLSEEYGPRLDENGQNYLGLIRSSTQRMNQLIDDLIEFSHVTVLQIDRITVDLSLLVQSIAQDFQRTSPARKAEWIVSPDLKAHADPRLMRIAFENLLGNAWKFTGKTEVPRIEFGAMQKENETVYFIRDNGAGFDMEYASRLFGVFQRLHSERDFTGTGIGLAIVQRIISRHGGRIWAEAAVDKGATFYFTLPE
jgi:PAS domain S-box-containing protein